MLGHSDVAPLRKLDPGELFDWYRLFVEGIAIWPTPRAVEWSDEQFFQALAAYGYDLTGPAKANIDPQQARRARLCGASAGGSGRRSCGRCPTWR